MANRKLRQIVTFSSLLKMSEELRHRDFESWKSLRYGGTNQLLPRARVEFQPSVGSFIIKSDSSVGGCLVLQAACRNGRWYTRYSSHITPTRYPKFVFETYSPFEFLLGKPRSRKSGMTHVTMHSPRGDSKPMQWIASRRRGGVGWFQTPAIIDDETGGFGPDDFWASDAHDDAELGLPHLPLASSSVSDWLASMDAIPEANVALMKDLGMRCLKSAARLCSKYPHMKLRAMPAVNDKTFRLWHSTTAVWMSGGCWSMPEVLLFWQDWTSGRGVPMHVSVSFAVPPHGRPDMDYTAGVAPAWCLDHQHDLALPYNYLWAKSPDTSWQKWAARTVSYCRLYSDLDQSGRDNASLYVNWSQRQDCVRVTRRGQMRSKPRILVRDQPCAMRPEDLESTIEESALMSSLPVC